MTQKLQDNISCKTTFHKLDKTDAVIMSGYSERLNAPNKPILLGGAGRGEAQFGSCTMGQCGDGHDSHRDDRTAMTKVSPATTATQQH